MLLLILFLHLRVELHVTQFTRDGRFRLLIGVLTHYRKIERRRLIRSWLFKKDLLKFGSDIVRTVFVIAQPRSETAKTIVRRESEMFGDILVVEARRGREYESGKDIIRQSSTLLANSLSRMWAGPVSAWLTMTYGMSISLHLTLSILILSICSIQHLDHLAWARSLHPSIIWPRSRAGTAAQLRISHGYGFFPFARPRAMDKACGIRRLSSIER